MHLTWVGKYEKMRGEISVRYQGKRSYVRNAGVWVGVEKVAC